MVWTSDGGDVRFTVLHPPARRHYVRRSFETLRRSTHTSSASAATPATTPLVTRLIAA